MSSPESFFVPQGPRFVATELTRGPWSPDHQHGGPSSALLARAIERLPSDGPVFQVARMTVEFLRPIPIAEFELRTEIVRSGKKTRIVTAWLETSGKRIVQATGLCIRRADVPVPAVPVPAVEPPIPSPEESAVFQFPFFMDSVGYHTAMEGRLARGVYGQGPTSMWMRMRVPVVPGETPSPVQRVMAAADSGNGVSVVLDVFKYTFINPDLTVYLHRPMEGEWVCLDAATIPESKGVGLADTRLHDSRGPIGRSVQSLILERRPGG
ncbi:MAG: thioesterase family protein [Nitrospirae bacterium]|nr:thioesterase family protein [Nitrospirota bacterium]